MNIFSSCDLKKISSSILEFLAKYKYIVIIAVLGLAFLMWPSEDDTVGNDDGKTVITKTVSDDEVYDMEGKLRNILGRIEGVGRLEVSLTLKCGVEVQYADEVSQSSQQRMEDGKLSQSEINEDSKVVVLRDKDGNESVAVVKQIYPEYLGAVIVCDGADSASVRLKVTNAVSTLTGLSSDRVSVVKMK